MNTFFPNTNLLLREQVSRPPRLAFHCSVETLPPVLVQVNSPELPATPPSGFMGCESWVAPVDLLAASLVALMALVVWTECVRFSLTCLFTLFVSKSNTNRNLITQHHPPPAANLSLRGFPHLLRLAVPHYQHVPLEASVEAH
ncbi:hypothetical protein AMECASPLE_032713 [Ameca splendens]|uniref:Uncharacterized protein n=1 Tax=Ameca splendens TaxID=208324 RepID=A0ABV0XJR5_9TELE